MNRLSSALLLLLFVLTCSTPSQQVRLISWKNGNMEAVRGWGSQYYDKGYQARLLHVDDVGVGAVGGADKHFYWVMIAVRNDGKIPVDVVPQAFTLQTADAKPKQLPYVSAQKIAEKIEKTARRDAMLALWGAMMATTTSMTNSTSSGTVMGNVGNVPVNGTYTESGRSTTTQRDDRLADLAVQRGRERVDAAQGQASDIMRRALRATTLAPGNGVSGLVWFERKKKTNMVVLRVPVGECIYEIPLNLLEQ
jgi:hypothetical protein